MEKPESAVLLDDKDFPICLVRRIMLQGTGADLDELCDRQFPHRAPEEIQRRLAGFQPPDRPVPPGFMRRYIQHAGSAAGGAVLS